MEFVVRLRGLFPVFSAISLKKPMLSHSVSVGLPGDTDKWFCMDDPSFPPATGMAHRTCTDFGLVGL